MNAISPVPLPPAGSDVGYKAALAVLADAKFGDAMQRLADCMASIYEPRRDLTQGQATAARELRLALKDLENGRALLVPLMAERAS